MADASAIAQLRRNVADDEPEEDRAWSDTELGERLDAHGGSIERATLDCWRELAAESASQSDYTAGPITERGSQIAAQIPKQRDYWEGIVAALDAAAAEAARVASAPATVAVPVQVVF